MTYQTAEDLMFLLLGKDFILWQNYSRLFCLVSSDLSFCLKVRLPVLGYWQQTAVPYIAFPLYCPAKFSLVVFKRLSKSIFVSIFVDWAVLLQICSWNELLEHLLHGGWFLLTRACLSSVEIVLLTSQLSSYSLNRNPLLLGDMLYLPILFRGVKI